MQILPCDQSMAVHGCKGKSGALPFLGLAGLSPFVDPGNHALMPARVLWSPYSPLPVYPLEDPNSNNISFNMTSGY